MVCDWVLAGIAETTIETVVPLIGRKLYIPAQSEVQRQIRSNLPIILTIDRVVGIAFINRKIEGNVSPGVSLIARDAEQQAGQRGAASACGCGTKLREGGTEFKSSGRSIGGIARTTTGYSVNLHELSAVPDVVFTDRLCDRR